MLGEEQKHLYDIDRKVLNICAKEKAITKGSFFDLIYANLNGWRFNEHKQYVFLRKYENELLLIAVNFDNQPVDIAINIPSHAFDYLQLPSIDSYKATDVLSGKKEEICLLPQKATETSISAYSGKILKIIL